MRNRNWEADLAKWAAVHGLRRSRRQPCGHGLIGRGLKSEDHRRYCLGESARLIAHGSVWRADTGLVLVAFPYGWLSNEPEHMVFWQDVQAYAARVGAVAFTPGATNLLHQLYSTDSCVVLYGVGLKWKALHSLRTGVEHSWVPKPEPFPWLAPRAKAQEHRP